MKKRMLSFLLVVVMVFGLCAPVYASDGDGDAKLDTSDLTVEGTNDVGDLLAGELQDRAVSDAGGNHISGIAVEGSVAAVELVTDRAGEVVVAVYDEASGQMLASGSAPVAAGTENVDVTIEGNMPQYFIATAFLLDPTGHEPLCEEYTTDLYTKGMQDFLDTDVDDYDADRVLNLDDNPNTNFMVLNEETILVQHSESTNVLTPLSDTSYRIDNADAVLMALQPGDTFYYEMDDGTPVAIKVASVSVDGSTVTVTEDTDVEWYDFFECVKIDLGNENGEVAPAIAYDNTNEPVTKTIDININKTFESDIGSVTFSANGSATANLIVRLYLLSSEGTFAEVSVDLKAEAHFGVTGKLNRQKVELAHIGFLLWGFIDIGFTPSLVYEASGEIKFDAVLTAGFGFHGDTSGFRSISKKPQFEAQIEAEVVIYVGLELAPSVGIALGRCEVLTASLPVEIGIEVTAKATDSWSSEKEDSIHDCGLACIDGHIAAKFRISISGRWIGGEIGSHDLLGPKKYDLTDFYYSIKYNEFGWGTCPHISYRVALNVIDENKQPISGAVVDGTGLEEAPVTDEEGVAKFYLPNGKYKLQVSYRGASTELEFEVKEKAREKTITLEVPEAGVIASGKGGDNITWSIYDNGVLTFTGSGDMYDYEDALETNGSPWWWAVMEMADWYYDEAFKFPEVIVGEGITSIGINAFYDLEFIKKVSLPSSLKRIGYGAFEGCIELESITIPEGITVIDEYTFEYTGLSSITLPRSLKSIERGAFCGCEFLKDIYYAGTESQWKSISIDTSEEDSYGKPFYFGMATVHYNSTGPNSVPSVVLTEEGNTVSEAEEPELTEATAEPEITEEPEATAEPEATEEPEITEEPEATAEPEITEEPEATAEPEVTEEPAPEETEIVPQRASQEETDGGNAAPVSAFDGTSDGQTALFTGLMPGEDYAVIVALDLGAEKLLAASNLLYIAQVEANENGAIALSYIPRTSAAASVRAFGPSCEHVWDEGVVTVDATCTEHGEKLFTCTICGLKRTEPTPALGHAKPEDESLIETAAEATCTEAGEIRYTCARCGEEQTEAVPALGHAWDEGKVTKEPTATEEGEKTYTCTRCGETRTETIPAKGGAGGNGGSGSGQSGSPKTGDGTPLGLYAGLLALCLGGLVLLLCRKRKAE